MATTAARNDKFRRLVFFRRQRNGKLLLTQGITALDTEIVKAIFRAIANQTEFEPENNPYGENDFGAVEGIAPEKVFWKIDYYDSEACEYGTDDPASPSTYRVMTVMLASEY